MKNYSGDPITYHLITRTTLLWDILVSINQMAKLLCLPGHNKKGPNRTMKVKRPFWRQRNMFGTRIKIMLKEQLVDPPIHYLTFYLAIRLSSHH